MEHHHSGFWIRLGANLLDGLIINLPLSIIILIIMGESNENIVNLLFSLYALILPVYFNGKTLGKHICGIKIARVDVYTAPSLWIMIKRNIIFSIFVILSVGIVVIVDICFVIFRDDKRSLHDIFAGTVVVDDIDIASTYNYGLNNEYSN